MHHRSRLTPPAREPPNDLAADHLRGRVNATQSAAFMSDRVVGPLVAGVLLDHGLAWLLLRLETIIPAEVNGVHEPAKEHCTA